MTEKDNIWTNLAVYLYDSNEKKEYYTNPGNDNIGEKLDNTQLEKFKGHVDRLISCLRGNGELVATSYNFARNEVTFILNDVECKFGF